MEKSINRRDFLKLAGLFSISLAVPEFMFRPNLSELGAGQNVVIVVFNSFSATNIPFYGYGRQTMPKVSRLLEKATVYHDHYANGPFTTPGTASLLTGTLPWTHRALDHNDSVADQMVDKSIFHAFDKHHCMAYTHNPLANTLLKQFLPAIDDYTPQGELFLENDLFLNKLFGKDEDQAQLAWTQLVKQGGDGYSYSLLLSRLYALMKQGRFDDFEQDFPRGIPHTYEDKYYILEHGISWLQNVLVEAPQPFMGYFHFLPPHFPYSTHADFYNKFKKDGFKPVEKPDHIFAGKRAEGRVDEFRTWYDEYILYVDSEFDRLYRHLEENGILENTWLILTSDHGEMFERGITGHQTPPMFQPLVRIPLVMFPPGQIERVDIEDRTSAIDVLPTLMHVTEQEIPTWAEGNILPPYAPSPLDFGRPIVSLRARGVENGQPISKGSAMLICENFKLSYVFGYIKDLKGGELIELFNLEDDPEELNDLSSSQPDIVNDMLAELKTQLAKTD